MKTYTLKLTEDQERLLIWLAGNIGISPEEAVLAGARAFLRPVYRRRFERKALAELEEMAKQ